MSLLSLLGFKTPGIGVCCQDAHEALRVANATILHLLQRTVVLSEELERARDVAASFAFGDGIDS